MQQFPELNENQVALLRAELSTGHVLDENFKLAMNDAQIVYTVFNDVDKALNFAKDLVEKNGAFECVVYNKDKDVIKYITSDSESKMS